MFPQINRRFHSTPHPLYSNPSCSSLYFIIYPLLFAGVGHESEETESPYFPQTPPSNVFCIPLPFPEKVHS